MFGTVGGKTFVKSLEAVRPYGRVATLFSTAWEMPQIVSARKRNLVIGYQQVTGPLLTDDHEQRCRQRKLLESAARLFDEGKLQVKVARVVSLKDVVAGHALVEAGHVAGKVVLQVAEPF